jgi:uncharacterized protein (TIRG00374 family)
MSQLRAARFGTVGQRVALAASLWVAASLALAGGTFWWQAGQVGGLASFNLPMLAPALCFAAISFGLRTLRWHFFLGAAGARPPLLTSLRTQLIGFSLTMTPGKVGEVYKCYLVEQRTGVPTVRTAPIVLFEKLMDAAAFAILAVVAAALLPGMAQSISVAARTLIVVGVIAVLGGILLRSLRPDAVSGFLLRLVGRHRLGQRLASVVVMALMGSRDILNRSVLSRGAGLSLVARTCDGMSVTWAALAIGINIPALAGVFALNSSGAIGGLSMLPGGIGVVEASMSVALAGFGAAPAAALAATLAARFLTFWLWVAMGLYLLVTTGEHRAAHLAPAGRAGESRTGQVE